MNFVRSFVTISFIFGSITTLQAQQAAVADGAKEGIRHASPPATATTPPRQILFFMNPNGRPCQMQLSILDGMKTKLSGLATVKYIKTTESSDREKFGAYGIRGLPSLIILDQSGKELQRFTPGIQDEETILSALTESKK